MNSAAGICCFSPLNKLVHACWHLSSQGTLLMWFLSGLHNKGVSVKRQYLLHCLISEYSLANQRLRVSLHFSVQAAEVRINIWKNTSLGRAAPLAEAVLCVLPQLQQRPLRHLFS